MKKNIGLLFVVFFITLYFSPIYALEGEKVWIKYRCFACHGKQGNITVGSTVPRIGGQNQKFVKLALKTYKKAKHRTQFMMVNIAKKMSDAEIKSVADYTAKLQTFVLDPMKNSSSLEGGQLYKTYRCHQCHGKNGIKAKGAMPNLAGQRFGFLKKSIREYRTKNRFNPVMTPRARQIKSEEDIEKISLFLSNIQAPTKK